MLKKYLFAMIVLFVVLMLVGCTSEASDSIVINGTPVPPMPDLDPVSISAGSILYQKYCASCHGKNLEGAPEWKISLEDGSLPSPPHDTSGHTWHHSDSLLLEITARGGNSEGVSRMPAFKDQLTQEEMVAILDFIKSYWGVEERQFQWWITAPQN
jgi:mono/diheme cytochrome c family protein